MDQDGAAGRQQRDNAQEGLAPVSFDGPLPASLLDEWRSGTRSVTRAWEFLKPAMVEGTVLSGSVPRAAALARTLDPIELEARIDRAKRVVFALGAAAGGSAPGDPWQDDALTLFFPSRAPVEFAIGVALEAHRKLSGNGVPLALSLHRGYFYQLGGRLWGPDAELVQFVCAESITPGETLVTRAVLDGLRPATKLSSARRSDLDHLAVEVHSLLAGASVPVPLAMSERDRGGYPAPYPEALREQLAAIDDPARWPDARQKIAGVLAHRAVVIADLGGSGGTRPYDILESGMKHAEIALSVARLVPEGGELVENAGGIVRAAFGENAAAVDFAWRLARALFEADMQVQVAVDSGPALLIPAAGDDPALLAGAPVRLATALCRERGETNRVYVTAAALESAALPAPGAPFSEVIQGVTVTGQLLDAAV